MEHETHLYMDGLEISVCYYNNKNEIELRSATIVGPEIDFMAIDISDNHTRNTLLSELEETLEHLSQPY
jgi:hypothetical protein